MKRPFLKAVSALSAISCAALPIVATAQDYQHGRDRGDRNWRDNRNDQRRGDHDQRGYRSGYDRGDRSGGQHWRYYGGQYGYNGYTGRWRTGQRFSYYNNRSYYVDDYGSYGLPAPRPGYRYYRDNNGDIVMAAIASGVIGLIVGGALSGRNDGGRYRRGY